MMNNGFCITDDAFEMLSSKIRKNTVRLTSKFSDGKEEYGFGFIIGERLSYLYVVTARHVVIKYDEDENEFLKALSVNGRFFYDQGLDHEAIILDVKRVGLDLALLKIKKPEDCIYLENSFSMEIKRNHEVWFVGRKREWYVPVVKQPGFVIEAPDISGIMSIQISGIIPGTSGAPLFSEKGIAGLILSDSEKENSEKITKAISIQTVKKFVESVNYPWGKKSVKSKNTTLPAKTKKTKERQFKNSIGMTFVLIPAGSFMMGSPENEPGRSDNEKQHRVTLTQDYYMQTTEVTQGQWKTIMGNNPSDFKNCGDDCPVEKVSWNDVQTFLKKLNRLDSGYSYRLPTEAEWEYAARAGTTTSYSFGNDSSLLSKYGNFCDSKCSTKLKDDSQNDRFKYTAPVKSYSPNPWGLYDMHGNVWEWCQDWYGKYPTGSVNNPTGPTTGSYRVIRGGSWVNFARRCRSAYRGSYGPDGAYGHLGFRLCAPGR
jgi:formylglycine-generating enzyme required for sulfatase activity